MYLLPSRSRLRARLFIAALTIFSVVSLAACGGDATPSGNLGPTAAPVSATIPGSNLPTNTVVSSQSSSTVALPTATKAVNSNAGGNSTGKLDVCALMREAGAESILGKPIEEPKPTTNPGPLRGSCTWTVEANDGGASSPFMTLTIYAFAEPANVAYKTMRGELEPSPDFREPVPGLSEQSYWDPSPGFSQLAVVSGESVLHFNGFKIRDLDKVTTLAKSVIEKLPPR